MKRDHSEQSVAKPSLFVEDVVSTVACFLFSFVCLVSFALYDGDCNLLKVTSLFPHLFLLSLFGGVLWIWLVLFFICREMLYLSRGF